MRSERILALTTGLALFSMFFGSGNLVFPLLAGSMSGDHALMTSFGIIFSGVFVPLLGCLGILLYNGQPRVFCHLMGRQGFLLFSLVCLGLMGPFGVLARCLTVAHGTFAQFYPEISLNAFSLVSCLLLFFACLKKEIILDLLGFWLTPLLLASLAIVCIISLGEKYSVSHATAQADAAHPFAIGAKTGYQMMDLFAALFFSGFVISQLRSSVRKNASVVKVFLMAACIAGSLLAIVYVGLVFLGAKYASLLAAVPSESMLATIATHAIGAKGGMIACAVFALACYTTAIVLTVLFADFLRKELLRNRIPQWFSLVITLVIAYYVSTLEFSGIAEFLGPILGTTYPFLILLTVWNIVLYAWKNFNKKPIENSLALQEDTPRI